MYYELLLLASRIEVHSFPKGHQTYKALLYPAWLRLPVDRPPPRRLVTRKLFVRLIEGEPSLPKLRGRRRTRCSRDWPENDVVLGFSSFLPTDLSAAFVFIRRSLAKCATKQGSSQAPSPIPRDSHDSRSGFTVVVRLYNLGRTIPNPI